MSRKFAIILNTIGNMKMGNATNRSFG
ncbi:uncharacterized protein METZ01_LOCUS24713 [marine metagenome]|uniref:Uncharacterized protein n=1 Tax=marine metagenome TaxID=408172 RepID=A0A381Q0Q3_9ZZZZ